MNVSIDSRLSHVAALIARSTQSHNLDWLVRFNDFLHCITEVRKRGSHTDLVVLCWLLHCEWFQVLDLSLHELVLRERLIRDKLESTMFSSSKEGVSNFSVCNREGIVHDPNAALVLDREANEDGDRRQVALYKVISTIKRVNPDTSVLCIERLKWI